MNKLDFLQKLSDRGYSRDEAKAALDTWRSSGKSFDDEQPAAASTQPKPGYLEQVARGMDQYEKNVTNSVSQPPQYPGQEMVRAASGGLGYAPAFVGSAVAPIVKSAATAILPPEAIEAAKQGLGQLAQAATPIIELGKKHPLLSDLVGLGSNLAASAGLTLGGLQAARPVVGTGLSAAGKGLETLDKVAGKIAQETSGASEQALREAGSKQGRAALQAASGKEYDIGQKLVDMVDNADDYMPEKQVVNDALKKMPPIKTDNVKAALESAKVPNPITDGAKNANNKIDDIIQSIDNLGGKSGDYDYDMASGTVTPKTVSTEIPATQFRSIRRQLDNEKSAAFDKDYKDYIEQAVLRARTVMKDDLIGAAEESGNLQYVDAMKSWSDKIEKVDRLKDYLGKNATTRANRAESFIQNLYGKNKTEAQRVLGDVQEIFGTNTLGEAKMAQLANQIGEGGKAAWLPRWTTGRSILAKGYGLAVGSPKIASQVTLPITERIGQLGRGAQTLGDLIKGQ